MTLDERWLMCEIEIKKKAEIIIFFSNKLPGMGFMKEQEKEKDKDEVIYKLHTARVQVIAIESIGREMTEKELNEFEDVFGESIYEHVYYCIRAAKDMVLWRSSLG